LANNNLLYLTTKPAMTASATQPGLVWRVDFGNGACMHLHSFSVPKVLQSCAMDDHEAQARDDANPPSIIPATAAHAYSSAKQ
jgi:hypothetical protein